MSFSVVEIVANSAKVTTALKLSQQDQETIASLKKEIEKVERNEIEAQSSVIASKGHLAQP